MSYFEDIDAWLSALFLGADEDEEEDEDQWFSRVSREIKAKILESYRNGQKAGLKPQATEDEQSRGGRKPSFRSRFRRNRQP